MVLPTSRVWSNQRKGEGERGGEGEEERGRDGERERGRAGKRERIREVERERWGDRERWMGTTDAPSTGVWVVGWGVGCFV